MTMGEGVGAAGQITVQSVVSSATMEGMVQFRWPEGSRGCQLTAVEAVQHALAILEAAARATTDAFLFRFLTDQLKTPPDAAAKVLLRLV